MTSIIDSFFNKKKAPLKVNGPRPDSGSFGIAGCAKSLPKLINELKGISVFQNVEVSKDHIKAMIVQSTDKKKNPYLYISFEFSKNGLKVFYTIPPEVANPQMRWLEVMKSVFTVVSLLEAKKVFLPEREDLYSKTVEFFDVISGFTDPDTLRLKYELERFRQDNSSLRNEQAILKNEKEGLNHQLVELEKRNETLEDRVKRLESLTNTELDREIMKWVEDHSGKLHEEKFCESFGISGTRLEERIDSLSKKGVIRIV